jgi:hypothetical protein
VKENIETNQGGISLKSSFETASQYFFWVPGILTTVAALPMMLSTVAGLHLTTGLSYFDESPLLFPIIGHWGIMVSGIGVPLFLSATNKQLRKTTMIYSTIEKGYIVVVALYCFRIQAPYAGNYLVAVIADGAMTIGGIWYLLQSWKLKQV